MSAKHTKEEIYTYDLIGVVEDVNDPKKIGRIKVRIERLHGRSDDNKKIPTEDIPWYSPDDRGNNFNLPTIGSVVYVSFENGNYYTGTWICNEHYNINLQKKLESLSDEDYASFNSIYFDDKHQLYHSDSEGVVIDYVKSNININPDGDINMNLRDNKSKLFLGSPDANQAAVLGNVFMDYMDQLINVLMGASGGAFIGNMGAPTVPSPGLLEVCNKFKAYKESFLSDHVFIVDDNSVKRQDREFDVNQGADEFITEKYEKVNKPKTKGYTTEESKPVANSPKDVPPNDFNNNLGSSTLPSDATDLEKQKLINVTEYPNGEIPIEGMTSSKYLRKSFTDERQYLLDEASKSLDSMVDEYNSVKDSSWNNIVITKGYQNLERQQNTRKKNLLAPKAGEDPFGNGNQVELYFGVDRSDTDTVDEVKKYLKSGVIGSSTQVKVLDWLKTNSGKFGWQIAGRTSTGDVQWWHWIFK